MEDYVMDAIKRASIFMIMAQALMQLRPSPSYERYFKFLTGIMTTVILLMPLFELFQTGITDTYLETMAQYTYGVQETADEKILILEEQSTTEYKENLEQEIKTVLNQKLQTGYRVDKVELLWKDEEEPVLFKITVVSNNAKPVSDIDIPTVEKIEIGNEVEDVYEKENSDIQKVRQELCSILQVEEEKVEVIIYE